MESRTPPSTSKQMSIITMMGGSFLLFYVQLLQLKSTGVTAFSIPTTPIPPPSSSLLRFTTTTTTTPTTTITRITKITSSVSFRPHILPLSASIASTISTTAGSSGSNNNNNNNNDPRNRHSKNSLVNTPSDSRTNASSLQQSHAPQHPPPLKRHAARKICLMVEPTPFTHVSGYANRFQEMLKFLRQAGDDVHILTVDSKTPAAQLPKEYMGYTIDHTQGFTFPLYNHISLTMDLPEMKGGHIIEQMKPDLIHVTSPGFLLFAAMFYARVMKVPLVMSYHTHLPSYGTYTFVCVDCVCLCGLAGVCCWRVSVVVVLCVTVVACIYIYMTLNSPHTHSRPVHFVFVLFIHPSIYYHCYYLQVRII